MSFDRKEELKKWRQQLEREKLELTSQKSELEHNVTLCDMKKSIVEGINDKLSTDYVQPILDETDNCEEEIEKLKIKISDLSKLIETIEIAERK